MELWEVVAREQIRDLVLRYNTYGDTGQFANVVDLFAPDAVLDTYGVPHQGHRAIEAVFADGARALQRLADVPRIAHLVSAHMIEIRSPSIASGRCYFQVLLQRGLDHWGRYRDDYACIDERWLFTRRRVYLDGYTPGGLQATFEERSLSSRLQD